MGPEGDGVSRGHPWGDTPVGGQPGDDGLVEHDLAERRSHYFLPLPHDG